VIFAAHTSVSKGWFIKCNHHCDECLVRFKCFTVNEYTLLLNANEWHKIAVPIIEAYERDGLS